MSLSEQLNFIRDSTTADLNAALDVIIPGLITNHQPNTVAESLFSSYFLPGFLGQNPNKQWVAQWVGIAGSPTAEVSVIDIAGKELFRVPPILLSKDVLFSSSRNRLSGIISHSTLLQNTVYGKENYLFSALGNKMGEISEPSSMPEAVARWRHILGLYGITTDVPQATSAQNDSADMFDYD